MPDDPVPMDDDALLARLARALEVAEPVPGASHQAALDAFAFRDVDAALAELVEGELAATRGDEGPLVFATGEAEIVVDRAGRDAIGQLSPPGPWAGRVESPRHGDVAFQADQLGRFRVGLAGGPVRIIVDLPDGAVRTDWFRR